MTPFDLMDQSYNIKEVLGFLNISKSGNPTPTLEPILSTSPPSLTPFEGEDLLTLERLLNYDPSSTLPPEEQKFEELKTVKPSSDELPELELKDLPPYLETKRRPPSLALMELLPTEACLLACVMLREKCHFMVKEGIVLGHKISKSGIEVDKAKVDVIAKFPHPTSVKGIRSFLGHAGFYRQFIQDFYKIAQLMTHLLEKDTPFFFSKECIEAFNDLKKKLTETPILVAPNWDLPFEIMCDASDFAVGAVLGQRAENLAADDLSRLENPHQSELEKKEITKTFPLEILGMVTFCGDASTSWFADFANYHAGNFVVKGMSSQ
ncbi:reverse transcriptase domain-containing protein [Tanacetum coccineum]